MPKFKIEVEYTQRFSAERWGVAYEVIEADSEAQAVRIFKERCRAQDVELYEKDWEEFQGSCSTRPRFDWDSIDIEERKPRVTA